MSLCNRFVLHHLECSFVDGTDSELPYPPVFIIGPPRAGSTLLYQVLLDRFDFSYLSNLHALFYGVPSLVERLFRPGRHRPGGEYRSQHGWVKGWCAPSECGQFWYRFFRRRPQFVSLGDVDEKCLSTFRGVIRRLEDAMGKPILLKNLPVALRLEAINKALPEAVFLVAKRDLVDNAHSLLAARKDICGSYETWLSMEPPNVDELRRKPVHEQVVEQVRKIHDVIDESRERHGHERFLDVHYEEFCRDTRSSLERIHRFLSYHRVPVVPLAEVPASFERNARIQIDANLYRKLREYVLGCS